MPKAIVLGNGSMLVGMDRNGFVQDFYFPYVGLDSHLGRHSFHRMGIWVDNRFSWLNEPGWNIRVDMQNQTLASKITAINETLDIELRFLDVVYNEKNIFIRKITIKNNGEIKRKVKIFINHQFDIYETHFGNTAYYNPDLKAIVHYKGKRLFLVTGRYQDKPFSDYSVGLSNIEGKEGTWVDAEDGDLSQNSIEHGAVDSTIAFEVNAESGSLHDIYYWIAVGEKHREVSELNQYVLEKSPDHLLETTQDYWYAWVNKGDFTYHGLSTKVIDLFKKSLLIIRTQVDNDGAILASSDKDMLHYGRDAYAYVWPRDAAFTAISLIKAGYLENTKKYLEFCNDVVDDQGYLLHRYRADKSLGSSWHPWVINGKKTLPIQEDETALIIYSFWLYYEATKNIEFVERMYNSLIKRMADFLVEYRDARTKLPKPSYDLWEEKYGISTFTASTVYAGLEAAGFFARLLGKEEDEEKYFTAAREVWEAILKYLYDKDAKIFYKMINFEEGEIVVDDTLDVSSFYGLFKFKILDIHDKRLSDFLKVIENELYCKTKVGGVGRYFNDYYHKRNHNTPGNPWIITTLWVAQYYIEMAEKEEDMKKVKKWLNWAVDKATLTGILSEQIDPNTGEQVSAAPLTWSHSEYVVTVLRYLEKLQELGVCKVQNDFISFK